MSFQRKKHWKLQTPLRKLVLFLLQLQFCLPSLPWSLLAICFCDSFLCYCFESKRPDRKGFLLFSRFRKTSFQIFFNETDSVKWSLNYFPKIFLSFVCNNTTLLLSSFSLLGRTHARKKFPPTFDLWFARKGLELGPKIKQKGFFNFSNTWIKEPWQKGAYLDFS